MTEQKRPVDEDDPWLDALAGRATKKTESRTAAEATAIRRALLARRDRLDSTVPVVDDSLYRDLLSRLPPSEKAPRLSRWRSLLALGATSFALGLAVARIFMYPGLEATRSGIVDGDLGFQAPQGLRPSQVIPVRVKDPLRTAEIVNREALRLGLTVYIARVSGRFHLYVDGLVPYSPDHETIRHALGLSDDAQGAIGFILEKAD